MQNRIGWIIFAVAGLGHAVTLCILLATGGWREPWAWLITNLFF